MSVRYTRVGWQDAPSTDTPIDAANLNHMDNGILALSEEVDTELPLLQEQINDISADIDTQIDEKVPPEVSSWLTEHVDPVGSAVVVDDSLTITGAAADAKKTGDEISSLKEDLNGMNTATSSDVGKALKAKTVTNGKVTEWEFGEAGSGLTEDIKQALLQIAEKVAYIDEDGQDYYSALENALYPPADLVSISAVYTQSGTVYDNDSLDSLKSDLVVTAHMSDSTTQTVTTYTLSGTLTVGTSTITVSYGGKTATFDVVVTMSRATRFGEFTAGYACGKAVSSTPDVNPNGIWNSRTNYRAAMTQPILNHGYTITVTDSSKYSVAVYDVINNTPIPTTNTGAIGGIYYQGGSKSISWVTSDSADSEYIMIALKKNNNTAFTTAELANGAEAVFDFTIS